MPKDKALAAEATAIDETVLSFDPDPYFARGDCRDAMLNVLRASMDWGKLDEQQQRDVNASIDQAAETIVSKLVRAIAAEGRQAVRAKVEQITVKDGLKLVLTAFHDHDTLVMLGDLQGKFVALVGADIAAHDNQRSPAHVDPDQPSLPVGDDQDLVDAADPDTVHLDDVRDEPAFSDEEKADMKHEAQMAD